MQQEEAIRQGVLDILSDRLEINPALLAEEYWGIPLTGGRFRLTPRELVYLFFEVEKRFGVRIAPEWLLGGRFNSISGVVRAVEQSMQANSFA